MAIENEKLLNLEDAQVLYNDLRNRHENLNDDVSDLKNTIDEITEVEMPMLIEKREKPVPPPTTLIQVCDLSEASHYQSGTDYRYQKVKIDFSWNGFYYPNPRNLSAGFCGLNAYDKDDNVIQIYRNGSSISAISNFANTAYLEKVGPREFKQYAENGTVSWTYTADGDIAYLSHRTCYIDIYNCSDPDVKVGMTFGESSNTYIPYGESEESTEETEYEYAYADELGDYAYNYAVENHTDEKPTAGSDKFVTSGGIADAIGEYFEGSYNLIDESYFDWTDVGGYWYLKAGYYFPVTEGQRICSNVAKPYFQFYDESKTFISQEGVVMPYTLVNIPADAVWCRMFINTSANYLPNIQGKILVYETNSDITSNDEVRPYVPPQKIIGNLVEGDIYETARPNNLNTDILNAAQYKAIRALNHQRNAFRIGTFNIYVPRGQKHWEVLKGELKDFSVDICGFQEVSNVSDGTRILQNYLTSNNWQFAYGSQALIDQVYPDKAIVSAYEIVSTNYYVTSTSRGYIRSVINLPKFKEVNHQFTLSVYSCHLGLAAADRLIEVAEILQTISTDTSDFIIVVADTNAFEDEADEHGKRPTWEAFINGGFTPIHYGESDTVTGGGTSIDQIFMGANISCLYYDVVDSNKYTVTIDGNTVPISDHDFVYADLQFNYWAVIQGLSE